MRHTVVEISQFSLPRNASIGLCGLLGWVTLPGTAIGLCYPGNLLIEYPVLERILIQYTKMGT